jgi:protein subunit release factor B
VAGERSQHQNRRRALARLAALVTERDRDRARDRAHDRRLSHYRLERGRPVESWTLDRRGTAVRAE